MQILITLKPQECQPEHHGGQQHPPLSRIRLPFSRLMCANSRVTEGSSRIKVLIRGSPLPGHGLGRGPAGVLSRGQ